MRICALADVPEVISLLATWFNNEWRAFDGRSTGIIEAQLTENLNRDSIPITFLALDASRLIGTVSLDRSDLPSHDHLSPWLASLYVRPEARRLGAGSALVRHLQQFGLSHGCDPLYLWTPGATRLYQRCGWMITHCATYNSKPITIMSFTDGNAYVAGGNAESSESDASPSPAWASSWAHRALLASARPDERGPGRCGSTMTDGPHRPPCLKETFNRRAKLDIYWPMTSTPANEPSGVTRREAIKTAGKALAGVAGLAALSQVPGGGVSNAAQTPVQATPSSLPGHGTNPTERLRVATCQFPVSGNPAENAKYIRDFIHQAAEAQAHLLHTSEACLSGYGGMDFPSFAKYDWDALRTETTGLRKLAQDLSLWLVLGSAHFLNQKTKPTNCLYLIDPEGKIADRYDKCFCTEGDQKHYSAGDRLVTRDIRGVRVGLAICYDICWPQLYIAYREKGATVMIHSFHNARSKGKNCLDTLNVRQVPTRCADNRMWAVCNNSSQPYSHWGSFIARPDATIPKQLQINAPGMLIHDFPDGLSEGGWFHNFKPMQKRDDEIMSWGTPSKHARQADGQAEP